MRRKVYFFHSVLSFFWLNESAVLVQRYCEKGKYRSMIDKCSGVDGDKGEAD